MAVVEVSAEGLAAQVTLNRPEKRNALTLDMWRAIPAAFERAAALPGVRAVVLAGAGAHFAAGADIAEFEATFATREAALASQAVIAAAMRAVEACPLPTIAAIRGACVGGGCGLALACDIRFATLEARFGVTPAKLGLAYLIEDTRRLVEAVGLAAAKDLLFTGRLVEAQEALRIGLIERLIEPEALAPAVDAYVRELAGASAVSQRMTKLILERLRQGAIEDDAESRRLFAEALSLDDFDEGRRAFLEKRAPRFT